MKIIELSIILTSKLGKTQVIFRDQVVPYLPNDLASYYGTSEAWKVMSQRVAGDLSSAIRPELK